MSAVKDSHSVWEAWLRLAVYTGSPMKIKDLVIGLKKGLSVPPRVPSVTDETDRILGAAPHSGRPLPLPTSAPPQVNPRASLRGWRVQGAPHPPSGYA